VQTLNLLGELPWRPRGPEGISRLRRGLDRWIGTTLDVANQLARRVAGTTDPWRSKPSAVAPVDDIDWVNGNSVGYWRMIKKLIRGPIPYSGARIPCSAKIIPCSVKKIPSSVC